MKLVWCPDTASKAYIDGVRAAAGDDDGSPALAELVAAMAGGWNAQLIVDAPATSASSSTSTSSSRRRPPATSLALAAAARRTGGRYARLDDDVDANDNANEAPGPSNDSSNSASSSSSSAEAAMARLQGVDLLVLDAGRRDAAAVLRAARPGPRGMVVVRHGDSGVRRRSSAAPPWGTLLAPGTRLVRAAYLPIGAGGVEVLHVGVGKGPSLPTTRHYHDNRVRPAAAAAAGGGRGRWISHVNHRTGEEHVFRRQ